MAIAKEILGASLALGLLACVGGSDQAAPVGSGGTGPAGGGSSMTGTGGVESDGDSFCARLNALSTSVGCSMSADKCQPPDRCLAENEAVLACIENGPDQCMCEGDGDLNCEGAVLPNEGPARCLAQFRTLSECEDSTVSQPPVDGDLLSDPQAFCNLYESACAYGAGLFRDREDCLDDFSDKFAPERRRCAVEGLQAVPPDCQSGSGTGC